MTPDLPRPSDIGISRTRSLLLRAEYLALTVQGHLQAASLRELATGLPFKLAPLMFAIGIAVFFAAPAKPLFGVLAVSFATMVGLAVFLQDRLGAQMAVTGLAFLFAGMVASALFVWRVDAPTIERQVTGEITGRVIAVERNRSGAPRYLMQLLRAEAIEAAQMPDRIRVSSRGKEGTVWPGGVLTGLARLQPVSGPAYPGGYDFSFHAWASGLGGTGFFMGTPRRGQALEDEAAGFGNAVVIRLNRLRLAIESRVLAGLPGEAGKLVTALVTGNRSWISEETQQALRKSGLAHILAISGLHMGLVTLTVIWVTRLVLACFPAVVSRYPVKKWATVAGFVTATMYLAISGAGVATQRAWIMISVMLLAVLMDRRAITMRSVALSALLILTINPASLMSPGFQMSFAAVACLVAGYEMITARRLARHSAPPAVAEDRFSRFAAILRGIGGYFAGLATTSLIAGSATAFFAAWHFHQIAPLGLLANVLAMPIVALLVMPLALFSLLLMPYGIEAIALAPLGLFVGIVVDIARWVSGLTELGTVGLLPVSSLIMVGFAMALFTVCVTRLRWIAVLPVVALMPFALETREAPDLLISENGRAIAVKGDDGRLRFAYPRRNRFVSEIWARAWNDGERPEYESTERCDSESCELRLPSGLLAVIVYDPELIPPSCEKADILVAPRLWWVNCRGRNPALVLKRYDFERHGTHAIRQLQGHGTSGRATASGRIYENGSPTWELAVETALPGSGRAWHRQVRPVNSLSDIAGSGRPVSPEP